MPTAVVKTPVPVAGLEVKAEPIPPSPSPETGTKPCQTAPNLFTPFPKERRRMREGREQLAGLFCEKCEVRSPCRDYARKHGSIGFWGGEGDLEREQWWAENDLERIEYPPRSYTVVSAEDARKFHQMVEERKAAKQNR